MNTINYIGVIVFVVATVGGGLVLFSGTWPPVLLVVSGSMEPNIQEGELVIVTDVEEYDSDHTRCPGITTDYQSDSYKQEKTSGDVIVFEDQRGKMIVHRAKLYVEEGDSWVEHINTSRDCIEIQNCPADDAGYITKGDANQEYDQIKGYEIVTQDQIEGKIEHQIPQTRKIFQLIL